VIITKLPFQPPGEPVLEAKIEILKANKGNPFLEIQLPHAALTLKQGFGRLIRSKTDRGFVAILDPRIQTKNYGRGLIASLPPGKVLNSFKDLKDAYNLLFP
jgi:ATP-dependent DNA helicase DinG